MFLCRKILGPLPAFVDVWHQLFMIQPSFQALLAITTTDYFLQSIFPDHCSHPPIAYRLITIWIISKMLNYALISANLKCKLPSKSVTPTNGNQFSYQLSVIIESTILAEFKNPFFKSLNLDNC